MLFCQVFQAPPGVFLMKCRPDPVLWQHKYQQEQYFLQVKEPVQILLKELLFCCKCAAGKRTRGVCVDISVLQQV